jgi:hypothetical protein
MSHCVYRPDHENTRIALLSNKKGMARKNSEAHLFEVGFRSPCRSRVMFDGRIIFNGFATAKNFVIGYYGVRRPPVKLNRWSNYSHSKL